MDITTRHYGPVVIMDLSGKMTFGKGDVTFRRHLLDLLEDGHRNIIINMKELKTIDSSGLGELIRSKTTCNQRGGDIKLLHLNPKVYRLLEVTRLIGIFDIYDSEVEAIPSFWDQDDGGAGPQAKPGGGGERTTG